METETETEFLSESSDGDDLSLADSSDECPEEPTGASSAETTRKKRNLVQMLFDRERTGHFSGFSRAGQRHQTPFERIPQRLKLHLKDMLTSSDMQGHIFMGLTSCGRYMLSHRVIPNESSLDHYSFNMGYKYTLYFWLYQPHKELRYFFTRRLFDDHLVDNIKTVTMTQWKNAQQQILVVHGAGIEEGEDNYITYVKVPKLGCLECKKLIEDLPCSWSFYNSHCLNCHLTVHTKYSPTETDPHFEPQLNLLCPEHILIISNGFMHMLRIDVAPPPQPCGSGFISFLPPSKQLMACEEDRTSVAFTGSGSEAESCNEQSLVARIIADFSDIETEQIQRSNNNNEVSSHGTVCCSPKTYDRLIFTPHSSQACGLPETKPTSTGNSEASQSRRRNQRIVTKSYRNGITTLDLKGTPSSSSMTDKSNAYEFSEDNEKCEKISTFRKRRLAEKKYEFSEDNSENIIPFTKVRSAGRAFSSSIATSTARSFHRFSPTAHFFHNSPCASPSSSPHPSAQTPTQTPPHLGFRSPPSSSMLMRSPSRNAANSAQILNQKSPPLSQATQQMLSYKPGGPLGALSPLQVSMAKRFEIGGSMSPNAGLSFLSPRREQEPRIVEMPVQGGVMTEKPVCTKKVRRCYVEEDDATSVITSEEDDCISPGYHTSLPMEVHGSCYSEMQMISQASYQRLRCASVMITQHSFDLETFTYYVISLLCQKHQKLYNVFYDWAYEVVNVCPLSKTVACLLMAQFSARDQPLTNCQHCSGRIDCVLHNRRYECRILFTWNMESGLWQVLDYGELREVHEQFSPLKQLGKSRLTFIQLARNMGREMADSLRPCLPNYASNLRVLSMDIRKPKAIIRDMDNMVEFHLKRRTLFEQ
ncbi:hypothetical protein KR018_000673 [Drosophila ironensis]|nr:hypothetical protein KR018_000673 [Drosophila ironensis]